MYRSDHLTVGWRTADGTGSVFKPLGKEDWKSARIKDGTLWTVPGLNAGILSDGKWHYFSFQLVPRP